MKLGQDINGIQSAGGRVSKDEPLPLVSLQDVSLGYDSTPVLHGVNVTISPGDLIGVAGPNGSGKTTLFRAILGLLPTLGGSITLRIIGIWLRASKRSAGSSVSLQCQRDR